MKDALAMVDCTRCGAVVPKAKATLQVYITDYATNGKMKWWQNDATDEVCMTEIILCRRCRP